MKSLLLVLAVVLVGCGELLITDLRATALHQLGLDAHKLKVPGRKRLDMCAPIREIIA